MAPGLALTTPWRPPDTPPALSARYIQGSFTGWPTFEMNGRKDEAEDTLRVKTREKQKSRDGMQMSVTVTLHTTTTTTTPIISPPRLQSAYLS
ncbi:hypothetical protein E2C01_015102 [Portunus trituberculatus]|uniref:Uncharacterized protein n=1 Tax=Portunus trituberculatus TaxID=210409 RepID=A0A5B7DLN8_PORTR|nr:hypothetical protein [Portunus trituberculatus]